MFAWACVWTLAPWWGWGRSTARWSILVLRALYDWTMRRAGQRDAVGWLAGVSFAESSFFPIPPDIMLIPMALANPARVWWLATVCMMASVVGGIAGYAIGYFLFETIGQPIINFYNLQPKFDEFQHLFNTYGAAILIIKGATPIPYKLLTITAGFTRLDLMVFMMASVISRSLRFYLIAALIWKFGAPIQTFIEKRLTLVTTSFVVLVIAGFLSVKLL